MKVLVLCGGESPERIVSLTSGDSVAVWIAELGYEAVKYDPQTPGKYFASNMPMAPSAIGTDAPENILSENFQIETVQGLIDALNHVQPDVVFPICHGGRGEDGTVQALMEWIGMPYTGSGPLACALAMNKDYGRKIMQSAGIPVAKGFAVIFSELKNIKDISKSIADSFGYPVIVKPNSGGSTIGLTQVHAPEDLSTALNTVASLGDDALIESYFTGREITVTVVDHEAYPIVEIKPKAGFYDYANKYTSGRTEYICPAEIDSNTTRMIQDSAVKAFDAMGCSGFARVDFLLNEQNKFICLEVNTLPGMTGHSLVPKSARANGVQPPQLMEKIIDCALRKKKRAFKSEPAETTR